ncbi:MAG: RluA family pseudouridine synthase [Aphanocapsa sp. GSE-SYN-MK-11-07L]|jgi:tRNA pseudouridine32 synthase/23S rRNA pseudouridine746 synthase|nr:RluA family pseudouridine synthase [Aphanocapsa sp. GSE-SYN-MK-11-07L]
MLHAVTDFISGSVESLSPPSYWYEGENGQRLPRTALAEAIAQGLMQQLEPSEGKMYGVLLVETASGEQRVLKAFSGLLSGSSRVEGWVPPLPGRSQVAVAETQTLQELERLKQVLISLQQLPERQVYAGLVQEFADRLQALSLEHQQRKCDRQQQRQVLLPQPDGNPRDLGLAELDEQSRRDGIERKRLKQQRDSVLQPLQTTIAVADAQIRELKQQRKALSQRLQAQMHATYSLCNFAGQQLSLSQVGVSMPSGTGDCCAPKLLHYAATHALKPLAMAEFWTGKSASSKVSGEFYEACADRCQPLLGFLLAGIEKPILPELKLIYEDEWLLAVNKPAGLLSVPGRYRDRQDSVLSRLCHQRGERLHVVHRLDQDTSGLLLLARDSDTQRQLYRQFEQRQVKKVYAALLAGQLNREQGMIDLPLWADPSDRPYQKVDWQRGKPSQTWFEVVSQTQHTSRVEFFPISGRTHQLRVHAADPQGLGLAIIGDRLYGQAGDRLYLHSRGLRCQHPHSGQPLHLTAPTPF